MCVDFLQLCLGKLCPLLASLTTTAIIMMFIIFKNALFLNLSFFSDFVRYKDIRPIFQKPETCCFKYYTNVQLVFIIHQELKNYSGHELRFFL